MKRGCGGSSGTHRFGACADCTRKCLMLHGEKQESSPVISFFKVMFGDQSSKILFLPPMFAPTLSAILGNKICLKDSSGQQWEVTVSILDGSVAFIQGWESFWLDHNLEIGDFLLFEYVEGSHFDVSIYNTTGCKKPNVLGNINEKRSNRTSQNFVLKDGPCQTNNEFSMNKQGSSRSFILMKDVNISKPKCKINDAEEEIMVIENMSRQENIKKRKTRPGNINMEGNQGDNINDMLDFSMSEMQKNVFYANGDNVASDGDGRLHHHINTSPTFPGEGNYVHKSNDVELVVPKGNAVEAVVPKSNAVEAVVPKSNVVEAVVPRVVPGTACRHGMTNQEEDRIDMCDSSNFNVDRGNRAVAGDERTQHANELPRFPVEANTDYKSPATEVAPIMAPRSACKLEMTNQAEDSIDMVYLSNFVMQKNNFNVDRGNRVAVGDGRTHHVKKLPRYPVDASCVYKSPATKVMASRVAPQTACKESNICKSGKKSNIYKSTECDKGCSDVPKLVKAEPVDLVDIAAPFGTNVSCTISADRNYFLELPKCLSSFTRSKSRVVYLRNQSMEVWPVLYHDRLDVSVLTKGWEAFSMGNSLRAGDTCTFQVESGSTYRVDVVRV